MKSGELWRQRFGKIEPWWPWSTDEPVASRVPKLWDSNSLIRVLEERPQKAVDLLDLVYYGSSDERHSTLFKDFRDSFRWRKKRTLVLTSVIGGLSCLNMAVLVKAQRIYLFDANPMQVLLFDLIRRLIIASRDKAEFLSRIRNMDYEAPSIWERRLQRNLALKMEADEGNPPPRGFPGFTKRSLERSWRYALNRFDRLKNVLRNTPCDLLLEDARNEPFVDFLFGRPNHWIFLSNIWLMSDRLQDSNNLNPPPAGLVAENDTILSYSRPARIRIRRYGHG